MSSIAGLLLGIATLIAGIGAIGSVIATYYIGGWGLVIAVWLFLTAAHGWKSMKMIINTDEVRTGLLNPSVANTIVVMTFTSVGIQLAFDPPNYSAWWGLATPVAFLVLFFLLFALCEAILNILTPSGRRK